MLGYLFKNIIDKEIDQKLENLNEILLKSFFNIKKDIETIKEEINQKGINIKKFQKFEQKLMELEDKIVSSEMKMNIPQIEQYKKEQELTFAQQKILFTLFQLKKRVNQAISTKSLAKFIYLGRNYGSVRSTLSAYLDTLENNKLITKSKLGKESYSEITNKGQEYIKSLLKKEDIKKKLITIND